MPGIIDSDIRQQLQGKYLEHESLARYTSWRIGGPADVLYKPTNIADLALFLQSLPLDEPLTWLGLGSNLLIRDGGIRGTVIVTQGALSGLAVIESGVVRAEAGVSCAQAARFAARQSLAGGEFLAGIPGTIGGALAMNAGAHGGETWDFVSAIETIDRQGILHNRTPQEYDVAYRSVKGPEQEWFLAGHFQFNAGNKDESLQTIRSCLDRRSQTQPINEPSCGSVFRNPEGDFAARLIEQCGLKGKILGGAQVSNKHANFIVNTGTAKASDIESLISLVAETVETKCGVSLHREVHIIGDDA